MIENAQHLAACLVERGLAIITGGTDTHIVLVDLRPKGITGAEVEERGLAAGLAVNKNMIPGDPTAATQDQRHSAGGRRRRQRGAWARPRSNASRRSSMG